MKAVAILWGVSRSDIDVYFLFDEIYFHNSPLNIDFTLSQQWVSRTASNVDVSRILNDYRTDGVFPILIHWGTIDEEYFGYYHDSPRPWLTLNMKKISRWSWFFRDRFARWVLAHELGHWRGLPHHKPWIASPFCIMSKPNLSFGRFCKSCRRNMEF